MSGVGAAQVNVTQVQRVTRALWVYGPHSAIAFSRSLIRPLRLHVQELWAIEGAALCMLAELVGTVLPMYCAVNVRSERLRLRIYFHNVQHADAGAQHLLVAIRPSRRSSPLSASHRATFTC